MKAKMKMLLNSSIKYNLEKIKNKYKWCFGSINKSWAKLRLVAKNAMLAKKECNIELASLNVFNNQAPQWTDPAVTPDGAKGFTISEVNKEILSGYFRSNGTMFGVKLNTLGLKEGDVLILNKPTILENPQNAVIAPRMRNYGVGEEWIYGARHIVTKEMLANIDNLAVGWGSYLREPKSFVKFKNDLYIKVIPGDNNLANLQKHSKYYTPKKYTLKLEDKPINEIVVGGSSNLFSGWFQKNATEISTQYINVSNGIDKNLLATIVDSNNKKVIAIEAYSGNYDLIHSTNWNETNEIFISQDIKYVKVVAKNKDNKEISAKDPVVKSLDIQISYLGAIAPNIRPKILNPDIKELNTIESIGTDIRQKCENYSNDINFISSKYIEAKTNSNGCRLNNIEKIDTPENPLVEINVDGKAEQVHYEGYQLYDKSKVYLTGGDIRLKARLTVGKTYTFSTAPYIYCQYENFRADGTLINKGNNIQQGGPVVKQTFTVPEECYNTHLIFYSGVSNPKIEDIDFTKIVLCEGTVEKPYEPYTGGVPSPNLDYPQEIKVVDKIGVNISGINKNSVTDYNGLALPQHVPSVILEYKDNALHILESGYGYIEISPLYNFEEINTSFFENFKVGEEYTIGYMAKGISDYYYVPSIYTDNAGDYSQVDNTGDLLKENEYTFYYHTFQYRESVNRLQLHLLANVNIKDLYIKDIFIAKGRHTTYTPYFNINQSIIPSKNLIKDSLNYGIGNPDYLKIWDLTSSSMPKDTDLVYEGKKVVNICGNWNRRMQLVKLKNDTVYTLSAFIKSNDVERTDDYKKYPSRINFFGEYDVDSKCTIISSNFKKLDIVPNEWTRISLTFRTGDKNVFTGFSKMRFEPETSDYRNHRPNIYMCGLQLEEGDTMTSYTPDYTNIAVNEIASLPNGVVDEVVNGGVIKRIGKVVLDGTESWGDIWSELPNTKGFILWDLNIKDWNAAYVNERENSLHCNSIKAVARAKDTTQNISNTDEEAICLGGITSTYLALRINKNRLATPDVAGLKKFLADRKASGNPVIVYYEVENPIFIPQIETEQNLILKKIPVMTRLNPKINVSTSYGDIPLQTDFSAKAFTKQEIPCENVSTKAVGLLNREDNKINTTYNTAPFVKGVEKNNGLREEVYGEEIIINDKTNIKTIITSNTNTLIFRTNAWIPASARILPLTVNGVSFLGLEKMDNDDYSHIDEEGIRYNYVECELTIAINKNRLVTQDLNGVKAWLAENPMHIVWVDNPLSPLYKQQNSKNLNSFYFNENTDLIGDGNGIKQSGVVIDNEKALDTQWMETSDQLSFGTGLFKIECKNGTSITPKIPLFMNSKTGIRVSSSNANVVVKLYGRDVVYTQVLTPGKDNIINGGEKDTYAITFELEDNTENNFSNIVLKKQNNSINAVSSYGETIQANMEGYSTIDLIKPLKATLDSASNTYYIDGLSYRDYGAPTLDVPMKLKEKVSEGIVEVDIGKPLFVKLKEGLRSVPRTKHKDLNVADKLVINPVDNTAKVIRKVGKKIFDGTENWSYNNQGFFECPNAITDRNVSGTNKTYNFACSHALEYSPFEYFKDLMSLNDGGSVVLAPANAKFLPISTYKYKLREWAKKGMPLTVYYELATPVEEVVETTLDISKITPDFTVPIKSKDNLIVTTRSRNLIGKEGLSTPSKDVSFWDDLTSGTCTPLTDGWLHIEKDNSTSSTEAYLNFQLKRTSIRNLKPNTIYYLGLELRNIDPLKTSGENKIVLTEEHQRGCCFKDWISHTVEGTDNKKVLYKVSTKEAKDYNNSTGTFRTFMVVKANSKFSGDIRLSLFDGDALNIPINYENSYCYQNYLNTGELRGLSQGAKDTIKDSIITQNIGELILDGTEGWESVWKQGTNTIAFFFTNKNIRPVIGESEKQIKCLCNSFEPIARDTGIVNISNNDEECVTIGGVPAYIGIRINKNRLATQNVSGFKAWLAEKKTSGNPVVVYYELANPVTKNAYNIEQTNNNQEKSNNKYIKNIDRIETVERGFYIKNDYNLDCNEIETTCLKGCNKIGK